MNPILFEKSEVRIRERGISLIELIMFIMIVSVALAGILLVMNVTTRGSADPLVHKQALAIAESLLEEVELMPFTFCDPDDVSAASAVAATSCTGSAGGAYDESKLPLGPETIGGVTEDRYGTAAPAVNAQFDNVSDYNGCQMNTNVINACDSTGTNGIRDINNSLIGPATGYRASIAVAINGMPAAGASPLISPAEALLITVTVTGPDNVGVVLEGIRTRYSPKAVP
jgi:MSHA pilin protein MshD